MLFADLPLAITPGLRKRMRRDVARLLPEQAQPSPGQWKMIFSGTVATCVVAGAGSGKSSSLALRVLLLHHYLGVQLQDISVVTFTRASRADFAQRLVRLFERWQLSLSLEQAQARVTTFHGTVFGWSRTLPGFAQLRAFEGLGSGSDPGNAFALRINEAQREQLNCCYHSLLDSNAAFAALIQALRQRANQLPSLPASHPEVQKRLAALVPAAQRDPALCDLIQEQWRKAGHWPLAGIDPQTSEHLIHGQVFRCHGYMPGSGAWVVLGADPSLGSMARDGARLSVRAEWSVKRTLFQAFFDKPLIWIDSYKEVATSAMPPGVEGPGFDYRMASEGSAQPLLDAFASMAAFIENLGLEVSAAVAALDPGEDALLFEALGLFWPALERQMLAQVPPILTYNRMFALFADPEGSALARLPANKLDGIRHLLVDEFQDISPQIARWLRAGSAERLRRDGATPASLMCVGDDWQSIYGWRGSSPAFFLDFAAQFPAPSSQRLMLRENFRSTQQIIDAAEYIVRGAPSLPGKKATAAAALDTPARKVQVRWKDGEHLLGVVEAGLRAGKSVLLLYRQARDDPRHLGRLAIMLAAQAKLPTEQRSLRCMTIHGAKGLEAELVVVLGDCTTRAGCAERNQLYALACLGAPGEAAYDRAQADEALRLAYVAITRAAREVHWYLDRSAIERDPYSAAGRTVGAPELFEDLRT